MYTEATEIEAISSHISVTQKSQKAGYDTRQGDRNMTNIKIIVVMIVHLISLSLHIELFFFSLRLPFIYSTFRSHYSMAAIVEALPRV